MDQPIITTPAGKCFLNCTGRNLSIHVDDGIEDLSLALPASSMIIEIQMHDDSENEKNQERVFYTIEQGKDNLEYLQKHLPGTIVLTLKSLAPSERVEGYSAIGDGILSNVFLHLEDDPCASIETVLHTDHMQFSGASF